MLLTGLFKCLCL